jgi:hypothetical protein
MLPAPHLKVLTIADKVEHFLYYNFTGRLVRLVLFLNNHLLTQCPAVSGLLTKPKLSQERVNRLSLSIQSGGH